MVEKTSPLRKQLCGDPDDPNQKSEFWEIDGGGILDDIVKSVGKDKNAAQDHLKVILGLNGTMSTLKKMYDPMKKALLLCLDGDQSLAYALKEAEPHLVQIEECRKELDKWVARLMELEAEDDKLREARD